MRSILLTAIAAVFAASASASYGAGQKAKKPAAKPAAKAPAAAAAKLKTTEFPDGTGTIGLPAGWTIDGSYRGMVFCNGPKDSLARMGQATIISRPDHPANNMGISVGAPFARDGDLVGAIQGILRNGGTRLIRLRTLPVPQTEPGVPAAYFLYEMESKGKRITALGYFSSIADNDGTLPYWQLFSSVVMAPTATFKAELPTLMAIWNSYQPNGLKPKPGSNGAMIDAANADSTRRRAQTLKEQQEMYDRINARFTEAIKQ